MMTPTPNEAILQLCGGAMKSPMTIRLLKSTTLSQPSVNKHMHQCSFECHELSHGNSWEETSWARFLQQRNGRSSFLGNASLLSALKRAFQNQEFIATLPTTNHKWKRQISASESKNTISNTIAEAKTNQSSWESSNNEHQHNPSAGELTAWDEGRIIPA